VAKSTERLCVDCGASLQPTGTVRKRYSLRCPRCRRNNTLVVARSGANARYALKVANVEHNCLDCGIAVIRSGRSWPTRCPQHKEARRLAENRRRVAEWDRANPGKNRTRSATYAAAHRAEAAGKAKAWYEANTDRVKAYRKATKSQKTAYNTAYYAANRDKEIQRSLEYARTRGHEAKRARDSHRYAVRRGSPTMPAERFTLDEIYERDERICHLCGLSVDRADASMDHLIPVSRGGLHLRANVKLAHLSCNTRKGNRM